MSKWIYGFYDDDNKFVAIDALGKLPDATNIWEAIEDLTHDAITRGNKIGRASCRERV